MLLVVAVVGNAFLVPVRRVIGAVKVEHDALGNAVLPPLVQVEPD
jgi:hypothetical protein